MLFVKYKCVVGKDEWDWSWQEDSIRVTFDMYLDNSSFNVNRENHALVKHLLSDKIFVRYNYNNNFREKRVSISINYSSWGNREWTRILKGVVTRVVFVRRLWDVKYCTLIWGRVNTKKSSWLVWWGLNCLFAYWGFSEVKLQMFEYVEEGRGSKEGLGGEEIKSVVLLVWLRK